MISREELGTIEHLCKESVTGLRKCLWAGSFQNHDASDIDRLLEIIESAVYYGKIDGRTDRQKDLSAMLESILDRHGLDTSGTFGDNVYKLNSALNERLMPECLEWPRFEDGEKIKFKDLFKANGCNFPLTSIAFDLKGNAHLNTLAVYDDSKKLIVAGESVQRPELLDKDGEPIKVGDIVYDNDGNELEVLSFDDIEVKTQAIETKEEWSYNPVALSHKKTETKEETELTPVEKIQAELFRLNVDVCRYFGYSNEPGTTRDGCPADNKGSCHEFAAKDILKKIKDIA